ncbi:MAG: hypothetical protein KDD44_06650 [Bdellovibrionales bacterium]|nr:hypothetical protein [Bdellovibrionales bacterium]
MNHRPELTESRSQQRAISQEEVQRLRQLVARAIERRRQALTFGVAKVFERSLRERQVPVSVGVEEGDSAWVAIEPLYQLRATVGGRFQNLKEKWVKAGFPLRDHRGDRSEDAQLNEEEWVELALWINRQGYEARLTSGSETTLFEVRKLEG